MNENGKVMAFSKFSINWEEVQKMKQNLGKIDRILRFALAFWWLGPWAPHYSVSLANWLIFIVGWIALVESFFGWCWLHNLFGINNANQ